MTRNCRLTLDKILLCFAFLVSDAAENTSDVYADSTELPIKTDAEGSIWLNRNGSNTSGRLYVHENLMQADHVPHTDIPTVKSIAYSFNGSNTSVHFTTPSLDLKLTDQHKTFEVNISTDVGNNVPENVTNESGVKPIVPVNHKKALKFRDVLGMLNAPRNEQSVTQAPVNLELMQSSISLNKSLNLELKDGGEPILTNQISQSNVSNHSKLHVNEDSVSAQKTVGKEEDLYKGYLALRAHSFQKVKERALQWLIDSRDSDYGWGEETARGMIALRMADHSSAKPDDMQLMSKQLHLKFFTLMSRYVFLLCFV